MSSGIYYKGEGIDVEFKTSQFELNKDAFSSICAFLNQRGGYLLLGVKNNGTVEGVKSGNCQVHQEIVAWMLLKPEITREEIAHKIYKSQSRVEKTIKK
ncbi:MAG TPA: ATP-binding protein [Lunatimonas sp.]|nr:ATP-binding protein [Lunatimonas sp.]